MIYLDSAALVKLVRHESASGELAAWLGHRSEQARVSSVLVEIEVPRAVRRRLPAALARVPLVLASVNCLELDSGIRAAAAALPDPLLGSLDAVHLATAQVLQARLSAFVSYDRRLLAAAAAIGLPAESPGLEWGGAA